MRASVCMTRDDIRVWEERIVTHDVVFGEVSWEIARLVIPCRVGGFSKSDGV